MANKIVFTGGGTAGHVVPNLVLMQELKSDNWDIYYIGSQNGMERELVEKTGAAYYPIATGKLRRYLSVKNLTDPFRVVKGVFDAIKIIKHLKPNVIFSKGGFVSVPVVIAGWVNKVPVIIHESDMTPGLANKISKRFARKVCVNFPETLKYVGKRKGVLTGTPIRDELFSGNKEKGLKICNFDNNKPVIFITGGSTGSKYLNRIVRETLDETLKKFQVIHQCGKGNLDEELISIKGYKQFEYISEELPHIFTAADIVISRAGANTIYELLQLQKPNILIPLSVRASRGDQILNAKSFEKQGFSKVLDEDTTKKEDLLNAINEVYNNQVKYIENMKKSQLKDGKKIILDLIKRTAKRA